MITSLQNTTIKNVVKLQEKASERRRQGLIVVEGEIEITLLFKVNIKVMTLFFCKALADDTLITRLLSQQQPAQLIEVSLAVFQKIAYRKNATGLLALAVPSSTSVTQLVLPQNPLLVVLEAVEKPGNLGAILRTADAAKVDAIIVCDPRTDLYNPNVIRASIGCVFTKPVVVCTTETCINFLKEQGIHTYAAALSASQPYTTIDFRKSTAIVMGTEATGLSATWLAAADQNVIIPMQGEIDSMNVSVATAVIVFEAVRQRQA
ncbi:MAG: RNA methyltransferase [Bacteroidota bacterium]